MTSINCVVFSWYHQGRVECLFRQGLVPLPLDCHYGSSDLRDDYLDPPSRLSLEPVSTFLHEALSAVRRLVGACSNYCLWQKRAILSSDAQIGPHIECGWAIHRAWPTPHLSSKEWLLGPRVARRLEWLEPTPLKAERIFWC